ARGGGSPGVGTPVHAPSDMAGGHGLRTGRGESGGRPTHAPSWPLPGPPGPPRGDDRGSDARAPWPPGTTAPTPGCLAPTRGHPRRRIGRRASCPSGGPCARGPDRRRLQGDSAARRRGAAGRSSRGGAQRRGHLLDRGDVTPGRVLLRLDQVEALVDTRRQATQLRLREAPFPAARFRPMDRLTSVSAALISSPGGWSGPPWSLLRMPRTAAQYSSTTSPAGSSGVVASASSPTDGDPSGTDACRRFSTERSIPRRPRTFWRSCTLAWLSASRTGLARSRRKWLAQ